MFASARASTAAARVLRIDPLAPANDVDGWGQARPADRWGLEALRGRLIELSARGAVATLTAAMSLVLEAQLGEEPVAWIALGNGTFYPPDVAETGIDLAALIVVRVSDATMAARAAERLLRSGAFGLVVLDFGGAGEVELAMAHQGRLVGLAQTHDAAVVCITDKSADSPSLGSLVSLRVEAQRSRAEGGLAAHEVGGGEASDPLCRLAAHVIGEAGSPSEESDEHAVTVLALKDKRRGPGWTHTITRRGPHGF